MAVVGLSLVGCMGAQEHHARVVNTDTDRVTVGTVQREIKVGMSGADVIAALGSPNVVTSDELRRENWVYDKISTDTVESRSSGGASILILGAGSDAGARSTTQREHAGARFRLPPIELLRVTRCASSSARR
jgi:hypothetical protein